MQSDMIQKNKTNSITISAQEMFRGVSKERINQLRTIKNLLVVCFSFFLLYLPFQSLANLQSTLSFENNIGVLSQAVIYMATIPSALFLPKLIIKKLGCKYALILCILTFIPYFAASFYPHVETLVPTAILLGMGNGPLWTTKCTYVNEITLTYAAQGSDSLDVITSKFFGIFYMIFQHTQIWGNLVSFLIFRPPDTIVENGMLSLSYINRTIHTQSLHKNLSCGAKFCGDFNENLLPPPEDKRDLLNAVFLCFGLFSALIVFLFLDPLKEDSDKCTSNESVLKRAAATFQHLKNTNQLLLLPLTIFSGMEQAFILGDYSKAFVACSCGLYNVGLVFICYGVVNATMSFLSGRLIKYVHRAFLFIIGAIGNFSVCTILLLWQPGGDDFIHFFVLISIWGMSDAIWLTQINALYGVLFRADEEAAFANFKLWESVGFSISYGCSIFLCVNQKIYLLLTFLTVGITGYITLEGLCYEKTKNRQTCKTSDLSKLSETNIKISSIT